MFLRFKQLALVPFAFGILLAMSASRVSAQEEQAVANPAPQASEQDAQAPKPATASPDAASPAVASNEEPKPDEQKPAKPARTPKQAGTSNDRLFNVLPNFLTLENAEAATPLSAGGKFKAVARGTFDVSQLPWIGILSGISQAQNSEPGYGQGIKGYAKRYGAYAADSVVENFMVGAALPSLFHQDPRYFQLGKGSFLHRVGYAVSRIVITRGDSGSAQFNVSEVLGSAISSTISNYAYHPREDRTIVNTANVWRTQMGYDAVSAIIKEFWPDIRKKMHPKAKAE